MNRAAAETVARAGSIGGLVTCAAVFKAMPFLALDETTWDTTFGVNLKGTMLACQAVLPTMRQQGGGAIVLFSSSLARAGAVHGAHYAATKGGLISMVRSLAVEFARYNVRAHAILPGWIETDMTQRLTSNETFHGKVMPRIPMRRWGRGEDFGGIAVYLMSSAARYHTGDTFVIDGGYSLF